MLGYNWGGRVIRANVMCLQLKINVTKAFKLLKQRQVDDKIILNFKTRQSQQEARLLGEHRQEVIHLSTQLDFHHHCS